MNVALVTDCFFPNIGGGQLVVHHLALQFQAKGFGVVVVAPETRALKDLNLPYKVETYNLYMYKVGFSNLFSRKISRILNKYEIEIVNIHKAYVGYPILKNRKLFKTPFILTSHGGDIQKYPEIRYGKRLDSKWEKRIRFVVNKVDGLIAISNETIQNYLELGADKDKIHFITNGTDLDRFESENIYSKGEIKKRFGINDEEIVLLSVGRYHIKKGYENLIKAVSLLDNKSCKFKLVIVGNGLHRLNRLVNDLGVKESVIFVSEQRNDQKSFSFPNKLLLSFYKNSDIFISSSIVEGFALVCVEAMSAGLPLVLTSCPGNADVFSEEDECGIYVKVEDSAALAKAIKLLIDVEETRKVFSRNAKSIARRKYSWENISSQYIKAYSQFL